MNQKSKRIRTVIVDDEELARQVLRDDLAAFEDVEVVAECSNGFEAVKVIGEKSPDLVFLDIQMPKLDGFEVLELLDDPPRVVFVTAYDEYALRAFEVHAVDYLLKPYDPQRLAEAIDQARRNIEGGPQIDLSELAWQAKPRKSLERILVKDGARVTVIPIEEVDYIEAQDDYIGIHARGKCHLKPQRLSHLDSLLDDEEYVRIHRSCILNIRRLTRIELYAKDSRLAVLRDGKKLPISRSGYARLKKLL